MTFVRYLGTTLIPCAQNRKADLAEWGDVQLGAVADEAREEVEATTTVVSPCPAHRYGGAFVVNRISGAVHSVLTGPPAIPLVWETRCHWFFGPECIEWWAKQPRAALCKKCLRIMGMRVNGSSTESS